MLMSLTLSLKLSESHPRCATDRVAITVPANKDSLLHLESDPRCDREAQPQCSRNNLIFRNSEATNEDSASRPRGHYKIFVIVTSIEIYLWVGRDREFSGVVLRVSCEFQVG